MSGNKHRQDKPEAEKYPARSQAQSMSANRYLRPEDAYIDPDIGYFGTSHSSHTSSRHGSDTYSPHQSTATSTGYPQTAYTQTSDSYQQYQYGGTSQIVSSTGSPYSHRRLTPVDDFGSYARHRHSPHSETPNRTTSNIDRSYIERMPNDVSVGKGKQKEKDHQQSSRKEAAGSRHGSGSSASSKRRGGSANERLVHGVFIRY
jgi:hypothetical protein